MNKQPWFAFRTFVPRFTCCIDDGGAGAGAAAGAGGESTATAADATATAGATDGESTAADTHADAGEGEGAGAGEGAGEGEGANKNGTETQADPADLEYGEDGVSPAAKKVIDSLKKTDPVTAKHLKAIVFADAALRKEFPGGLKEAQALKNTVLELAGDEGLDGLKESITAWKSIDDRFAKGDQTVLQDFAKFNPDSFEKIIPPAIEMLATSNAAAYGECMPSAMDKLSQVAPEVYGHYMSGVLTATLDNYKVSDTLKGLVQSLGTIKDDKGNVVAAEEIAHLQNLLKTVEGFRELAKKAPPKKEGTTEKKADPAKSEYETKLAELKQRETAQITKQINDAVNGHATTKYTELVAAELKSEGITVPKGGPRYNALIRDIDVMVGKAINADNKFKDKYNSLVASGKAQDAIALANSRFDQVAFKAVRDAVTLWSKDIKGTTAKPGEKTAAGEQKPVGKAGGVVELKSAPARDKVDWARTSQQDYLWGKAYLKGDNRLYKF
jgi:hypothetical protein